MFPCLAAKLFSKNLCNFTKFRHKINYSKLDASFVSFSERKSVDIMNNIGIGVLEAGKKNAAYFSYPYRVCSLLFICQNHDDGSGVL